LLAVSETGAKWVKANEPRLPSVVYHNAASLSSYLNHLIDNCFVCFGDRVYRQVIGIPMGTNCAVFLANYFLFTFELQFASKCISDGDSDTLRHFAHTVRYVDDILSMNNPLMDSLRDAIYPDYLPLNREHRGTSVPFLDFLLYSCSSTRTPLRSRLFDKRTLPKLSALPLTHYPHSTSFLPSKFKYNCALSQAHRLVRRCTSKRAFTYSFAVVIKDLIGKGLSPNRLFRKARSFAKSHLPAHYNYSSPNQFLISLKRRVSLLSLLNHTGHSHTRTHSSRYTRLSSLSRPFLTSPFELCVHTHTHTLYLLRSLTFVLFCSVCLLVTHTYRTH
jgi:hypothetical protein